MIGNANDTMCMLSLFQKYHIMLTLQHLFLDSVVLCINWDKTGYGSNQSGSNDNNGTKELWVKNRMHSFRSFSAKVVGPVKGSAALARCKSFRYFAK